VVNHTVPRFSAECRPTLGCNAFFASPATTAPNPCPSEEMRLEPSTVSRTDWSAHPLGPQTPP
jgi:hypothetical protein